jgi:heme-degrading monooxygenase HmoA
MVTRIWHGRTSLNDADSYLQFLLTDGTQEYRDTRGNISIKVWRHIDNDCCHFYTVTEWKDLESVKLFAGDDYEKAVYYPQDNGILLEFEEKVIHFESHDVTH